MAVTNIPNVQNWTVTPQNGQSGYFDLMNTWLGQSTLVIASLRSAITAQNLANAEVNTLASQAESNAIIATGLANYQGEYSTLTTYSKGQSTSVAGLYYTSKVDGNSNHAVTDSNYWVANPINVKYGKTNILGTVSQTSGVPTGAIIESGSNVNGKYTKFADGTMICTGFTTMEAHALNTNKLAVWTLPHAFIDNSYNFLFSTNTQTGDEGSNSIVGLLNYNGLWQSRQPTYAIISTYSYRAAISGSVTYAVTAIGRWF